MIPLWAKAAAVGIAMLALTGLYFRYEHMVGKVVELETALESEKVLREELQKQQAVIRQAQATFNVTLAEARKDTEEMRQMMSKHDLDRIAKAKPTLLTKKMEKGTRVIFREIEDAANTTK